jgi:hypothetical protein
VEDESDYRGRFCTLAVAANHRSSATQALGSDEAPGSTQIIVGNKNFARLVALAAWHRPRCNGEEGTREAEILTLLCPITTTLRLAKWEKQQVCSTGAPGSGIISSRGGSRPKQATAISSGTQSSDKCLYTSSLGHSSLPISQSLPGGMTTIFNLEHQIP